VLAAKTWVEIPGLVMSQGAIKNTMTDILSPGVTATISGSFEDAASLVGTAPEHRAV
jgi:hypothetical protein